MKKSGILQGALARVIATSEHGDLLLIGDAGMPIPDGVECIDLALCEGHVPFKAALCSVLSEMTVQKAYLATETSSESPAMQQVIDAAIGDLPVERLSHEDLKALSTLCKAAVRTGEYTPYANIILESGVNF